MKILEISSKDNEKIKTLKKLGAKKYREKSGKFIVENLATIYDGLKSGVQPESLFLTQDILDSKNPKVEFILDNIKIKNIFLISSDINKYFSSLDTSSGIAAVYKIFDESSPRRMSFEGEILYLNGISDPGNFGTILRSAASFGIKNIVVDEFCVDAYNPKTIQSSKDAIFKLNIFFDEDRRILSEIKKNMEIFVTDVEKGEDVSNIFKGNEKFCVVLGSESHGVSEEVRVFSDKIINIKSDSSMESLNVAVSAGIILYEMYKRK